MLNKVDLTFNKFYSGFDILYVFFDLDLEEELMRQYVRLLLCFKDDRTKNQHRTEAEKQNVKIMRTS